MNETGNGGYSILVIEWDGKRPPTRWYNRLHKLGLITSGDKEISPMARREGRSGVVSQEGALILNTESEARALAHLATDLGAKAVTLGHMEITELSMSREDQIVMNRIQSTLGRRGRPETPKNWVVTCLDEMISYEVWGQWPVHCKTCGSFHVSIHEGNQVTGSLSGTDLWSQWSRSRFMTGTFENPVIVAGGLPLKSEAIEIVNEYRGTVEILKNSALTFQVYSALSLGNITEVEALRFLDYGLASLKLPAEKRSHNRLKGIEKYFLAGGAEDNIILTIKPTEVDAFDINVFGSHNSIARLIMVKA